MAGSKEVFYLKIGSEADRVIARAMFSSRENSFCKAMS